MMKNMKEKLRNARGFTLVELLAVIVILGIIAAIAVPSIGNLIENARGDADIAEQDMIVEAARLAYAADDAIFVNDTVNVSELVSEGYLEGKDVANLTGTVTYNQGSGFTFSQ